MPKIYLLGAAILLLAGCQQPANEAAPAENGHFRGQRGGARRQRPMLSAKGRRKYRLDDRQAPDSRQRSTASMIATALPARRQGSEERLQVSAESLRFHESIGEVRGDQSRRSDGAISVEADFQGEGESWRNILRLSLGAGGTLTVIQPDGSSLTRIPCP